MRQNEWRIEFIRADADRTTGSSPDRPGKPNAFYGLVANIFILRTKKIPAGRVALGDWSGCYDKSRQHIKKQRHHFAEKNICIVQVMVFPVVIYGCENWTIKKAEGWRIDAFKLRCWRRLLRCPWTARRSNQSILKEINPKYSLKGLILKLKLQ